MLLFRLYIAYFWREKTPVPEHRGVIGLHPVDQLEDGVLLTLIQAGPAFQQPFLRWREGHGIIVSRKEL